MCFQKILKFLVLAASIGKFHSRLDFSWRKFGIVLGSLTNPIFCHGFSCFSMSLCNPESKSKTFRAPGLERGTRHSRSCFDALGKEKFHFPLPSIWGGKKKKSWSGFPGIIPFPELIPNISGSKIQLEKPNQELLRARKTPLQRAKIPKESPQNPNIFLFHSGQLNISIIFFRNIKQNLHFLLLFYLFHGAPG